MSSVDFTIVLQQFNYGRTMTRAKDATFTGYIALGVQGSRGQSKSMGYSRQQVEFRGEGNVSQGQKVGISLGQRARGYPRSRVRCRDQLTGSKVEVI